MPEPPLANDHVTTPPPPPSSPPFRFPPWRRSAYVRVGHRLVEGWLDPFDARIIDVLLKAQDTRGMPGSVGEIGVHHGKLFLLAYLASRRDEAAFAVDVFEQQGLNADASGRGDESVFRANLRRHAGDTEGLEVFACSSLQLTPKMIFQRCGRARFVSIDGGHTATCTLNDLRLAEEVLADGGLVLIDDYFNPAWPGVSTGVAQYLLGGGRLKPFLITRNKVALTREGGEGPYVDQLRCEAAAFFDKSSWLYGNHVEILGTGSDSVIRYRTRHFIRSRPALKAVAKRVLRR